MSAAPQPHRKRKPKKLPAFLRGGEPARLVAACKTRRDRLIVRMYLYHGLRLRELASLRPQDLDFPGLQIFIYRGKGGKDAYIAMHLHVVEELHWWLEWGMNAHKGGGIRSQESGVRDQLFLPFASLECGALAPLSNENKSGGKAPHSTSAPWLFPSPRDPDKHLSARAIQCLMTGAARRAKLFRPNGKPISPHVLRHTFATEMLQGGADIREVQEAMRHESLQSTGIYLHCTADRTRAAVQRLDFGEK